MTFGTRHVSLQNLRNPLFQILLLLHNAAFLLRHFTLKLDNHLRLACSSNRANHGRSQNKGHASREQQCTNRPGYNNQQARLQIRCQNQRMRHIEQRAKNNGHAAHKDQKNTADGQKRDREQFENHIHIIALQCCLIKGIGRKKRNRQGAKTSHIDQDTSQKRISAAIEKKRNHTGRQQAQIEPEIRRIRCKVTGREKKEHHKCKKEEHVTGHLGFTRGFTVRKIRCRSRLWQRRQRIPELHQAVFALARHIKQIGRAHV